MGILDIFKIKKTGGTFSDNELEQCLLQAGDNMSARKEFYQKLLWNPLFVLTKGSTVAKQEYGNVENDTKVQMVVFEGGHIPVFTSENRIFDEGILKRDTPYFSLRGQDLFEVAKGNAFVLNPYSKYGKEFTPVEIEDILNGTIYDQIDEEEMQRKRYQEFSEIYERAGKRQEELILIDGFRRRYLSATDALMLEESIEDFKKCLDMCPEHWQSMFLMAKAFQRLGRHAEALELLETAFNIELDNHSISMEASLEAMHGKDIAKALYYSLESLKRKPNDVVLMGNHAMNLLLAEKDNEALSTIEEAIMIQPNDAVNRNIESMVKDVIAGKRKRPDFEDSIQ